MDFQDIRRLLSDDRISLEYLWKNHETSLCIPFWLAKLLFYGLEYAERGKKASFEDAGFRGSGWG